MYTPHIYSFIFDGHLGCFHVLGVVNSADVNIEAHIFSSCSFFSGYMFRVGLLNHMATLLLVYRSLHAVVHSGCSNLHSHQHFRKFLFSSCSPQHLFFVDVLTMAILTGVM